MDDKIETPLTLLEVCNEYIYRTLKDNNWNRTMAAKSLDISLRCVRYKIRELNELGFGIPDNDVSTIRKGRTAAQVKRMLNAMDLNKLRAK